MPCSSCNTARSRSSLHHGQLPDHCEHCGKQNPIIATMRPRVPRWAQGVIGVIAFIILAQLIGLAIPASVLPRISTVLDQAARLITDGRFLADMAATIEAWALGLLLATVIAVPLGLILGS